MRVKTKLIIVVSAFSLLIVLALLSITFRVIRHDIEESILTNFMQQQKSLRQMQTLVYDRLVESALLISQNPAFKANVSLNDLPSIAQVLDEFADLVKVDLLWVADKNGFLTGTYQEPERIGQYIMDFTGIETSLQGNYPDEEYQTPVLWKLGEYLYQVVSIPIATNNEVLGILTLGAAFTDYEAATLQLSEETDVHIITGGTVVASTLRPEERSEIEALFQTAKSIPSNENSWTISDDGSQYLSYVLLMH